ncbi:putative pectinesterase/pectinesterase inhibitor 39 [Sesamum angolense]|uniref:Pectinesterase n=1 Tax=Sesamum angolense TaxID=2727404 RepID=A0AAE1X7Z8_9LAMI|nr:putative pectinesterase/pectinesterase inhibitor 39 [Sesamum angolense]
MSKLLLFTLLPLSALLFLLTLFSFNIRPTFLDNYSKSPRKIHVYKHVQIAQSTCEGTLYPDLCVSTVAAFPELRRKTLPEIISGTINVTMKEVRASASNCSSLRRKLVKKLEPLDLQALDDCLELFSDTVGELKRILADLSAGSSADKYYDDLQTLLSGAMTNQDTCLDGFAYSKNNTRQLIQGRLKRITKHMSNSLAMVKKLKKRSKKKPVHGEEFPEYGQMKDGYPTWLKKNDRRLLQTATNATKYDLVVAQDGSGNFTTINEALAAAPNNSDTRFVIYIKGGAYYEYIEVVRKQTMIIFLGDGIGKTLIKGNRSVVDGWTTFRSSTVAVLGNGFIAKGITFENYAGPSKHQAVALRSGADFSAFYQCSFVAYQDTLYVHSLRQFYRECDIYGTIDFIFGNAAVVFQNSNLYARRPNDNQQNIFTAQGREDPNQNTGISILNCKVAAAADLIPVLSQFRTFLGRPWKQYSRTVFMFSKMENVVDPRGWLEWNGTFALDTLYYGEYMNRGPGSNTSARVTWPGYRVINSSTEASQFTVANFIQGNQWLPATTIPFYPNLTATSAI